MDSNNIVFFSSLSTGLIALIALMVRYCFLSKCNKIKCCCIEIDRQIENEPKITHNNNDDSINNIQV